MGGRIAGESPAHELRRCPEAGGNPHQSCAGSSPHPGGCLHRQGDSGGQPVGRTGPAARRFCWPGPARAPIPLACYGQPPGQALPRRHRGPAHRTLGGGGHLSLRSHRGPPRGLRHRHAAADGQRRRSTSATSSATPTPTPSPATSACAARPSSTRWAGTTTASPRSGGCRTSSVSAATEPRRTTRASSRPPRRTTHRSSSAGPTSSSCAARLVVDDEIAFDALFRRLGLSVDWNYLYTTIDDRCTRVSQRAFLRNLVRGEAYQAEAPTLWDVDFRTAVAQAELEDRESPGAYHRLAFHRTDGAGDLLIDTTRPELLAACVAVVAHPSDARYQAPLRRHRANAAVRRRGAGAGPPPRRPGEGHRRGDGVHLRRPRRRHLVAGASAAGDGPSSGATVACCPSRRLGSARRPGSPRTPSWPA